MTKKALWKVGPCSFVVILAALANDARAQIFDVPGTTDEADTVSLRRTEAGAHRVIVNGGAEIAVPAATNRIRVNGMGGNDTIDGQAFDFPDGPVTLPMTVDGGLGNDTIRGGTADDILNGSEGEDTIHGFHGHDTISGGGGNDRLFGGTGVDRIQGGEGNDTIAGDQDRDFIHGNSGDDDIWGDGFGCGAFEAPGDGIDLIRGEAGQDRLFGCGKDDDIFGGDHKDLIYGLDGEDTLSGDDGTDKIFGGALLDDLRGGRDGDSIYGEGGVDVAEGGAGDDRMFGGPRPDLLEGNAGNDKIFGQGDVDILLDGDTGDDLVVGGAAVDPMVLGGPDVLGDTCAECPPDGCAGCEVLRPGVAEIGAADPVTATFDSDTGLVTFQADPVDWLADTLSVQDVDMIVGIDPVAQRVIPGIEILRSGQLSRALQGLACPDPLLGADLRLSPVELAGRDNARRFRFTDGRLEIVNAIHGPLVTGTLVNMRVDPRSLTFRARWTAVVINRAVNSPMLMALQAAVDRGAPLRVTLLDSQATKKLLAETRGFTESGSATGAGQVGFESRLPMLGDGCFFPAASLQHVTKQGPPTPNLIR